MHSIILFTVVATALSIIVATIYAVIKIIENKKQVEMQNVVLSKIHDEADKTNLVFLTNRCYIYYYSQIIYTAVYFLLNVLSIVYTLATSISIPTNGEQLESAKIIISILAVTFVIINIFLKPSIRVQQFLDGWKRLDKEIRITLQMIESADPSKIKKRIEFVMDVYYEIEKSFSIDQL